MSEKREESIILDCTGVLLCGGHSSRMGFDKALLQKDGRFLLHTRYEELRAIFARVLAVCEDKTKFSPYEELRTLPYAEDHYPDTGPLGGICTAFEEAATPWLFVMACDMPFPYYNLMYNMVKNIRNEQIALCEHEDRWEPLFAFYHRSCLPVLLEKLRAGERKLRFAFGKLQVETAHVPKAVAGRAFANLNTPEDLARWGFSVPEEESGPQDG